LNFNISAITGRTGDSASYPRFVPSQFLIQRIEYVVNNVVINTDYDTNLFLFQNLFTEEFERQKSSAIGSYYTNPTKAAAKATATNDYIIKLKSFISVVKPLILNENQVFQLRVYMKNIQDVIQISSAGSGTATCNINSAQVIVKSVKLPAHVVHNEIAKLTKRPFDTLFHDVRYQSSIIQSGVTQASIILSSITGRVPYLAFTVRNSSVTANTVNTFLPIASFNILSSGGESIVGGQPISANLNLQHSQDWSLSAYQLEDNANVYVWCFSSNIIEAIHTARALSAKHFTGAETLQIFFNSSTSSSLQIDIFTLTECLYIQKMGGVHKQIL
jgi:hypothetical protein